ncbi:MAG: glycosyltransferase family 2 protein [Syntrophaceae bacterium]|nr:glycosyltransferase family 2 protein [Syntrophaceae bacterium]
MFPSSPLTISVVVPVKNGGAGFRKCLSALIQTMSPSNELVVVADGDTDGSWRVAEEFGAKVLRIPVSQGPAKARNLGAQLAQGDILFFIDADVVPHPDAIAQVEAAFRHDPQLAALFGSYDQEPAESNFLSQYKNLSHHYVHQISNEEASTFWAGCGAIRRQIFLQMGGFDESYKKPCIEDIELGYRLKQAGYRIRLLKDLQVKHLKRWGIISMTKSDFFDRALPWTELILRDRRFVNDLNLRLSNRLSVIFTYGLLITLVGGIGWPKLFWVVGILILLLLILNAPIYRFFLQKRGLWFLIRALPWHWFYYFYSGLAFAIGLARSLFYRDRSQKPKVSSPLKGTPDPSHVLENR